MRYIFEPKLDHPDMIAAWPGMGYIAKISADYLRRRLNAKLFAEVIYYHNILVYNNGVGELSPIRHRFYVSVEKNLIASTIGIVVPNVIQNALSTMKSLSTSVALVIGGSSILNFLKSPAVAGKIYPT